MNRTRWSRLGSGDTSGVLNHIDEHVLEMDLYLNNF